MKKNLHRLITEYIIRRINMPRKMSKMRVGGGVKKSKMRSRGGVKKSKMRSRGGVKRKVGRKKR